MTVIITGHVPYNLNREEVRAVFHATETLLNYHNLVSKHQPITVTFTDDSLDKTKTGSDSVGHASYESSYIEISYPCIEETMKRDKAFSTFVTIAILEMIHVFIDFDNNVCEKCTSTLTAKLKPDVVRLANILSENTYKRAGYIAHTKISYKPKGKDHYDDDQYHHDHEKSRGSKFRRKTCA